MENLSDKEPSIFHEGRWQDLPNGTAVLVLGIISIVTCCCYGVLGLVCGVIALVLAKKDLLMYRLNPGQYSQTSYKNLRAGKVCAIIGVTLSLLFILMIVVIMALFGIASLSDPEEFLRHYNLG